MVFKKNRQISNDEHDERFELQNMRHRISIQSSDTRWHYIFIMNNTMHAWRNNTNTATVINKNRKTLSLRLI